MLVSTPYAWMKGGKKLHPSFYCVFACSSCMTPVKNKCKVSRVGYTMSGLYLVFSFAYVTFCILPLSFFPLSLVVSEGGCLLNRQEGNVVRGVLPRCVGF
ncbi:hypothetical protein, unlikely [Trypanosoma brucei gambiense DAL972]|uniref:Uncharacterized protein n=1 Tax=Trypanosoma brucei gambiense (strain MHOM/CI/86/DAL972) TaxID=679716 RepID=D0A4X4_TRYB9|nr:hypothetical protein, unlikely [Trypanosoma brucei gambiense DAL972]CBH16318.1 hypothetical protein, unlikely [Trypanosoma brucei gambiense DAL972]|eukprot:XP_011778582.1 hypothetical protein, unlikely [Trypanosoma brucei gambiense DAL972]